MNTGAFQNSICLISAIKYTCFEEPVVTFTPGLQGTFEENRRMIYACKYLNMSKVESRNGKF